MTYSEQITENDELLNSMFKHWVEEQDKIIKHFEEILKNKAIS